MCDEESERPLTFTAWLFVSAAVTELVTGSDDVCDVGVDEPLEVLDGRAELFASRNFSAN